MRVFSVEMLVKEEGAAVVEAALKRLKKETQDVAAEFKKTSGAAGDFGRQSQTAGGNAQIAGDRAAKAAIGFAAVGQSIARTGSVTADAGTRIIEAGSQIAMMFGPGGLAVAALLGFAAAAVTSFGKAGNEAKKMAEESTKALREMVLSGDITNIDKQLRDVQQGVLDLTTGEFVGGLDDLREKYKALNDQIAATVITEKGRLVGGQNQVYIASQQEQAYNKLVQSAVDLRKQIQGLETDEAKLLKARQLAAGFVKPEGTKAGKYEPSLFEAARTSILKQKTQFKMPEPELPPILPTDFLNRVKGDLEQTALDLETMGVDVMLPVGATIGSGLSQGLAQGIEGGVRSGLESAIASGNIGDAFKAMGQSIIQSMARAMVDVALKAINFAKMLASIQKFMAGNPLLAIAAATALLVLARAAGGGAGTGEMTAIGGPSGLTYGAVSATGTSAPTQIIFGQTSATTAAGMQPRQAMNVTVIGPNDPSAQRAIQELMTKANSRGWVG